MSQSKLQAALDAANAGFRVFPLAANGRTPLREGWPEEATTDRATIERWWRESPASNIGVATGRGLVVVDADCKYDRPGLVSLVELELDGLPPSFRVRTPSGGVHVYLHSEHPHRNRVDTIPDAPGIDIRGERGFVVGAGSTIDGKDYVVEAAVPVARLPAGLDEKLRATATKHADRGDEPLTELDMPHNVAKAIAWLERHAPEAIEGAGGDTTTYSVSAELRALGISEPIALELMLEHWNEQKASPPWLPDELAVKVANGFRHGQGAPGYKTPEGEFGVVDIDVGEPPAVERPEILDTKEKAVAATPYVFVDPATIPPRDWLLGRHLIRKFVSVTVAPGNIGKSSLTIAEALAMTTGKNLLRQSIHEPLRVWYWNLEDPYDELQRRIQAACQHYGLGAGDIGGRLFVDSGREKSLRTAISDKNGTRIVRPVVDGLAAEMLRLRIDCIIVDPFVSSHGVPENDNPAIDMVAKEWGRIAERANAAVELVHHTRKQGGEEITTESSRGGKALTDAARDVRVLNRMTKEEGDRAGVENHRLYFRTYSDKANMSPPADRSDWFKLESVGLANGDDVGVVTPWEWPDPFQDLTLADVRKAQEAIGGERCRADVRSSEWVGLRVASALGIDVDTANGRERVKKLVAEWVEKDWLRKGIARDEKGKDRPVVYVGKSVLQTEFEDVSE